MERQDLLDARAALRALHQHLAEDIGARILRVTLDLEPGDVKAWISQHGDPVQDAGASLDLIRELGVRERPIIEAGLRTQRPDNRLDPLHLAVATTLALLDALLDSSSKASH